MCVYVCVCAAAALVSQEHFGPQSVSRLTGSGHVGARGFMKQKYQWSICGMCMVNSSFGGVVIMYGDSHLLQNQYNMQYRRVTD